MSKSHDTTCVGLFQQGKVYFKTPPCEVCQRAFSDIMVIGSPPLPTTIVK